MYATFNVPFPLPPHDVIILSLLSLLLLLLLCDVSRLQFSRMNIIRVEQAKKRCTVYNMKCIAPEQLNPYN